MDFTAYLDRFQKAADQLDRKFLEKKQIAVDVGIYRDSVFLKLYKTSWSNLRATPDSESNIFFSIWVNDTAITERKILYNIHAFKLRKLIGYVIASRSFASNFRKRFNKVEHQWQNVSVKFGPLTLMEGWKEINEVNLQDEILNLAKQFFQIEYLIDDTLKDFKPANQEKHNKH